MVTFAGYELPVQYTGIIAESKAVRDGAGMFDVSHMARLKLTGDRTLEFLENVTTNDVAKLQDETGQYSLLPNDLGGAVDDIIVYRMGPTEFRMVVNAANHAKDVAWLTKQNNFGVEIEDRTEKTSMIAVQGPKAFAIVKALATDPSALDALAAFGVSEQQIAGCTVFAARSGYTGEDGFELICENSEAPKLWDALVAAGVVPCGLGSRDVLRVEAGLPLYGHELNDTMSPIEATLGWVVSKTKSFIGSDHYNQARTDGTSHKIHGIRMNVKRIPAPDMKVFCGDEEVGVITSGVYSPLLDCAIGFARVKSACKLETEVTVDIRGKMETGRIVSKRFLKVFRDSNSNS